MRPRSYRTEGIILHRINVGEADRILTVMTRNHGKIRCIAKGVRRPTSTKAASVELFTRSRLFLVKGRSLDLLTQSEVLERFSQIRTDLGLSKACYHLAELVDALTAEGVANESIYTALLEQIRHMSRERRVTRGQIRRFEENLLTDLGFGLPKQEGRGALKVFIEGIIERRLRTEEMLKET